MVTVGAGLKSFNGSGRGPRPYTVQTATAYGARADGCISRGTYRLQYKVPYSVLDSIGHRTVTCKELPINKY